MKNGTTPTQITEQMPAGVKGMAQDNQATAKETRVQEIGISEQAAFLHSILESSTEYSIIATDLDRDANRESPRGGVPVQHRLCRVSRGAEAAGWYRAQLHGG